MPAGLRERIIGWAQLVITSRTYPGLARLGKFMLVQEYYLSFSAFTA